MTGMDERLAQVAEALCRADDTMFHHERTDDFPCTACKSRATVIAPLLTQWSNAIRRAEAAEQQLAQVEAERDEWSDSYQDVLVELADLRAGIEAMIPRFEADYGIQSSPVSRLRALLAGESNE